LRLKGMPSTTPLNLTFALRFWNHSESHHIEPTLGVSQGGGGYQIDPLWQSFRAEGTDVTARLYIKSALSHLQSRMRELNYV